MEKLAKKNKYKLAKTGYVFSGWVGTGRASDRSYTPGEEKSVEWDKIDLLDIPTEEYVLAANGAMPQDTALFGTYDTWGYTTATRWVKAEGQQLVLGSANVTMSGIDIFPAAGFENQLWSTNSLD